jgi:Zn-dependent protease with chaperone function
MSGLIPLIAALALIEASLRSGVAPAGGHALAAGLLTGALFIPVVCETGSRLAARWRLRWPRLFERWETAVEVLILGWFAWLCLGLGWASQHSAYSITLLPWVAAQMIGWFCLPAGLPGAGRRFAHLGHQLRYGLAPLLLALPILDGCAWIGNASGWGHFLATRFGQWANVAGSFVLAVVVLAVLPRVLILLWRAGPLPASALADRLQAACVRAGVPIAGLRLWPVAGGSSYNAMVLGLVPWMRYVLFTPDLLRELPPRQVEAVLGHELGHVRHRHLWLYLLFAVTAGLGSWTLADPLRLVLQQLPFLTGWSPALIQGLISVGLAVAAWRLAFGILSRACERQADLAGAQMVGDPQVMGDALAAVAAAAGQEPEHANWRHGSIAARITWLQALGTDPEVGQRHGRMMAFAWLLLLGTAAGFGFAALHRGLPI